MKFTAGQRVIYTKRGESRFFDTEWPGVYVRQAPSGKHAVRLDGRTRVSLVRESNLRLALGEDLE